MKVYKSRIKVILPKKIFFHDKEERMMFYVCVPSEWNKARIDRFITEAAKTLTDRWLIPKKHKKGIKYVVVEKEEKIYIPQNAKYYKYDFDDKCGEWED